MSKAPRAKHASKTYTTEWYIKRARRAAQHASKALYQKLDTDRRQIRLLALQSLENSDQHRSIGVNLRCSFDVASLDSDIEYDALSYVWGDTNILLPIQANNEVYFITESLYGALKTLRQKGEVAHYLWADALCINQHDSAERSHQVRMMGDIYRKANALHAWLGFGGPGTGAVVKILSQCGDQPPHEFLETYRSVDFEAWADVLQRRWFSRLWVVQEVALARRMLFHLGEHTFSAKRNFASAFTAQWWRLYSYSFHLDSDELRAFIHKYYRALLGFVPNCPMFTNKALDMTSWGPDCTHQIVSAMGRLLQADVTDRRDKIYGLLGLLPNNVNITPDYLATEDEVSKTTMLRLIEWSNSVCWLHLARWQDAGSAPSWALHLGRLFSDPFMGKHYCAAGETKVRVDASVGNGRLRVAALWCDEIASVGAKGIPRGTFDFWNETETRQLLRDWRELSKTVEAEKSWNEESMESQFWRTIIGDEYSDEQSDFWHYDAEFMGMLGMEQWIATGKCELSPEQRTIWAQNLVAHVPMSLFFVTKSHRFGTTESLTRKGDKIAIFAGEAWPFILRPATGDLETGYQLVGPCYCNTVMYGETIPKTSDDLGTGAALDSDFEMITLI